MYLERVINVTNARSGVTGVISARGLLDYIPFSASGGGLGRGGHRWLCGAAGGDAGDGFGVVDGGGS